MKHVCEITRSENCKQELVVAKYFHFYPNSLACVLLKANVHNRPCYHGSIQNYTMTI